MLNNFEQLLWVRLRMDCCRRYRIIVDKANSLAISLVCFTHCWSQLVNKSWFGYVIPLVKYLIKHTCYYCDTIMGAMASHITSLTIVYSTVYSGANQRKHQSSASLAFVQGMNRWLVNCPHTWPVTRQFFNLMTSSCPVYGSHLRYIIVCTNDTSNFCFM